jgi:membrane protease YdiL (CAAX protease family)
MYPSFKTASIWAVIWRGTLLSILVGVVLGLSALLVPPLLSHLEFIESIGVYVVFYFITARQIKKQSFSYDAVKGNFSFKIPQALFMTAITVVLAAAATLMVYPLFLWIAHNNWLAETWLIDQLIQLSILEEGMSAIQLFLLAVVAAPIVEELFFRGLVLNKWAEKYGAAKGVFWSSFFFMIIHMPSLFIPQLLVGVFCALVYMKTKHLIYPILVHAFYNLLIILPVFFQETPTGQTGDEIIAAYNAIIQPSAELLEMYVLYSIACAVLVVLTLILFKWYGKNIGNEQTPYLANIHEAADFIAYEKERPLTEEEYLNQWEEKQEIPESTTNMEQSEEPSE